MDPEVWEKLVHHEEILRLVLARLSWDTNRRLRSVSKEWNATLSEPSFLTWASMLTDRSFYSGHRGLKWVDRSATDTAHADLSTPEHPKRSLAEAVCLLSTTSKTCAVANFDFLRWFKLPPLQHPPFGQWDDFTVSGAAEGLLLLEGKIRDRSQNLHELSRYLVNPLTNECVKLPPVPKFESRFERRFYTLLHPMILTVDKDKFVKVIATEFLQGGGDGLRSSELRRILMWRQHANRWDLLETDALRGSAIRTVEHAVFAGGELFLHTKYLVDGTQGHRIIKCERHGEHFELDMDFFDHFPGIPILHLFQHRGVLKCLIGTWKGDHNPSYRHRHIQYIRLCEFDHANGRWLHESMTEMPTSMVQKLYNTLPDGGVWRLYIDVEGDFLCIGNRLKAGVIFFYNLMSLEWCESVAKEYEGQNENTQQVFLWSPKGDNAARLQS